MSMKMHEPGLGLERGGFALGDLSEIFVTPGRGKWAVRVCNFSSRGWVFGTAGVLTLHLPSECDCRGDPWF